MQKATRKCKIVHLQVDTPAHVMLKHAGLGCLTRFLGQDILRQILVLVNAVIMNHRFLY